VHLVTLSFSCVASTYQKRAYVTPLLDLPLVGIQTFLEGVLVLPNSDQVGGSSRNNNTLSSRQASGPALQKLDVQLRTCSGEFSFLDPCAPYATSLVPCLHFTST
jgi:hypothetical protein